MEGTVLVGVLRSREDLKILLEEKWYRIPVAFVPKKKFTHIAFYEPLTGFGKRGKRIAYYARISKREVKKRIELLPGESAHPRAEQDYVKFSFRKVEKLSKPIRNVIPRRVSFGFTDLKILRSARDILQLYHVAPTEQIIERELHRLGVPVTPQYRLSLNSPFVKGSTASSWGGISSPSFKEGDKRGSSENLKHYRLDLAVFCKDGNLAIECDNRKAHSSKIQKLKDKQKDLALKTLGWRVIRLTEADILGDLDVCISRIYKGVTLLGGVVKETGSTRVEASHNEI
ncbi:MAG: DUF559 domain-containing protein [Candidatus Taylorbacteria bacterium]|nr:DUF559 domain-containing protein [Candidatus Taylorbacteria bacterium]